jgi:hypothetical protein
MSTLLVMHGRSGIVCSGLIALCFAAASYAQSTPVTGDEIPPASEVKYRHPIPETGRFIAYLLEIPPHQAMDDCELSDGLQKSASPHAYRSGDIQYFETASSSWKNSGRTESHLALISFR